MTHIPQRACQIILFNFRHPSVVKSDACLRVHRSSMRRRRMYSRACVSSVDVAYVCSKNKKRWSCKKKQQQQKEQSIKLLPWLCYQGDTEILSMSQGLCFHGNTYEWGEGLVTLETVWMRNCLIIPMEDTFQKLRCHHFLHHHRHHHHHHCHCHERY